MRKNISLYLHTLNYLIVFSYFCNIANLLRLFIFSPREIEMSPHWIYKDYWLKKIDKYVKTLSTETNKIRNTSRLIDRDKLFLFLALLNR